MYIDRSSICFRCAKACGGCSWSDRLEMVEGCTVINYTDTKGKTNSRQIVHCPEFVRGTRDDKRRKGFTEDGCCKLLEAMLKQLRDDYRFADCAETRRSIERFLLSEQGKNMLQFSDPEAVISGLRRMVHVKK